MPVQCLASCTIVWLLQIGCSIGNGRGPLPGKTSIHLGLAPMHLRMRLCSIQGRKTLGQPHYR